MTFENWYADFVWAAVSCGVSPDSYVFDLENPDRQVTAAYQRGESASEFALDYFETYVVPVAH